MARDFKTKRSKPGRFSGWIGLGCGLGLGLAVAGVVYLKDHKLDAPVANLLPELANPQVLEGFDGQGEPKLRPARRPIHSASGFTTAASIKSSDCP